MNGKKRDRRRFLKQSAALAGLAAGATRLASGQTPGSGPPAAGGRDSRAYGERSRFEASGRAFSEERSPTPTDALPPLNSPLQNQMGIITPSPLHFTLSHGYPPPDIDSRQHRLLIHGMVDRPLFYTVEELKRLPSVSRIHFVECNSNTIPPSYQGPLGETVQGTHGWTSCSEWTGVPLALLLREAGVQKEASWIVAEGAEAGKHTKSIPLAKALDDCLVAYGQNGEAVRPEQGYPLRLVAPGFEGINNVKWLRRIKLVDQPTMAKMEAAYYVDRRPDLGGKARWFRFEIGPKSVITRPSGGQKLPGRGFYEISGLAWSGGGAIRRVEVSTDGGRTWKDAQLQEPVHRIAHTRFTFPWTWDGEEAVLQSRCTDERGQVQPSLAQFAEFWRVSPDFFKTVKEPGIVGHVNWINPWRVSRDGSVHRVLFS